MNGYTYSSDKWSQKLWCKCKHLILKGIFRSPFHIGFILCLQVLLLLISSLFCHGRLHSWSETSCYHFVSHVERSTRWSGMHAFLLYEYDTVAHIHKLSEKYTLNANTCERARVRWKKTMTKRQKFVATTAAVAAAAAAAVSHNSMCSNRWVHRLISFLFSRARSLRSMEHRERATQTYIYTHTQFSFANVEVYSFAHLLSSQNKTQRFPMHYSPFSVRAICFVPMIERFHNRDGHTACPKTIWLFFLYVPIFVRESHSHSLSPSFSVNIIPCHSNVSHITRLPQFRNGFVTVCTCNLLPVKFCYISHSSSQ